jgi:hypothetical protein
MAKKICPSPDDALIELELQARPGNHLHWRHSRHGWEQIFYGEFDGRRKKRVLVKIIGE